MPSSSLHRCQPDTSGLGQTLCRLSALGCLLALILATGDWSSILVVVRKPASPNTAKEVAGDGLTIHWVVWGIPRRRNSLWRASLLALGCEAALNPANALYQTRCGHRFLRLLRSRARAMVVDLELCADQTAATCTGLFKRLCKSSHAASNAINPTPSTALNSCIASASPVNALSMSASGASSTPKQNTSSE